MKQTKEFRMLWNKQALSHSPLTVETRKIFLQNPLERKKIHVDDNEYKGKTLLWMSNVILDNQILSSIIELSNLNATW